MARPLLLCLLAACVQLPGCSKANRSQTAMPGEGAVGSATAEEAYSQDALPTSEGAKDEAEAPPAPPMAPAPSKSAPAGGPVAPVPEPRPAPDATTAARTGAHARQIVYTAHMNVAVHNLVEAMDYAEKLPDRLGGWIHQRGDDRLILRLPAPTLRDAMGEIGRLGVVVSRNLAADDVTAEYTDLETRIRVLRETQAQLSILLKRAHTVEEALRVQAAFDQVTMQLELALGRMRQLQDLIAYSTLHVVFGLRGAATDLPSSNDPFPWVEALGVEATEWR